MNAPQDAEDLGVFHGFGTYSVFYRNTQFGIDGQPVTFYEWLDTTKLENGKLKGMGGLPWNLLNDEMPDIGDEPNEDLAPNSVPSKAGDALIRSTRMRAKAGITEKKCYIGVDDFPTVRYFSGRGFMGMRTDDSFEVELDGMIVSNPGKVILKGKASTKMPDGSRHVTVGAPLVYAAGDINVEINGRLLSRTNECGSYMLTNAMWFDQPIQDSGSLMCIDPDYGIRKSWGKASWNLWQTDTQHDRCLYQIREFVFNVQPHQIGDFTAPWGQMHFEGVSKLAIEDFICGFPLDVVVEGWDNVNGGLISVETRIDGVPASSTNYSSSEGFTTRTWRIKISPSEGRHWVDVYLTDATKNTTHLRRELRMLPLLSENNPSDPSNPLEFNVAFTQGTLDSADVDTFIKIAFTEPVTGVGFFSLNLMEFQEDLNQWKIMTGISRFGPKGEVTSDQTVTGVLLIPPGRLKAGTRYMIYANPDLIHNLGNPTKTLLCSFIEFKTTSAIEIGSPLSVGGDVLRVAALGSRMFMGQGSKINAVRLQNGQLQNQQKFGAKGEGTDFLGQRVISLRAFSQVPISSGQKKDLLLVTTDAQDQNHQGALWGFDACSLELLFGVSLGLGATGYSPSVDQLDGVILVGRLASSLLTLDVATAIKGWKNLTPEMVMSAGGANQGAVLQPLYLSAPDYWWEDNHVSSSTGFAHWGAALVPGISSSDQNWIRMAVGYSHLKAQFKNTPMTGLPSANIQYWLGGSFVPELPFIAETTSESISRSQDAPPADYRALPGSLWDTDGKSGKWAAKRIAVVPRVTIDDGGKIWQTNLVVGFTSIRPYLKDSLTGETLQPLGNGLVISEKYGNQPAFHMATWPIEPPFGPGVPYEIQYTDPCVDVVTNLVGVSVKNLSKGETSWFILDLTKPKAPRMIAKIRNQIHASMNNGVLFAVDFAGKAHAFQIVNSVMMPTECETTGDLQITASPRSVSPKLSNGPAGSENQSTITIKYKAGVKVTVTVSPVEFSGGHNHDNVNRPFGRVRLASVTDAPNGNEGEHIYQGTTGLDGKVTLLYTASIVGGRERIVVTTSDNQRAECQGEDGNTGMLVRIPGLQLLPDGNNYIKIGGNDFHHGPPGRPGEDNNHWGTALTIQRLIQIADEYASRYPGSQLRFNDMSLPCGGLFDINGTWTTGGGHGEHRVGINCDLSDQIPQDRWPVLEEIFQAWSPFTNIEHNRRHWHLRIIQ